MIGACQEKHTTSGGNMPRSPDQYVRPFSLPLAIGASAILAACATQYSEAPIPSNFATTKQVKLQAGAHWNAIAAHSAKTLIDPLRLGRGCIAPQPDCGFVYVQLPKEASAFAQAFRTQLITSFVNEGVNVAKQPAGATEVDFDIQIVKFSPRRLDGTFTSATAIYAGLWALDGLWVGTSPGAAGALAAVAFDATRWSTSELASGPTPQYEVIITISASDATQYLGRATNVYYIADSDEMLYKAATAPVLHTITVRGGQ